jgi:subtilase family serine protease
LKYRLSAVLAATATVTAFSLAGAPSAGAANSPFTAHLIKVNPDIIRVSGSPDTVMFGCQNTPIDDPSAAARCYVPSQIQTAYGVTPLLNAGNNGHGRTIVIVDAYQNPYISRDLATFDATFGLADPVFHNTVMPGTPPFSAADPNQVGWGEETTLDVLWAHAIAPGANIELVSAASNNDTDILAATQYAVDNDLGDVLSQSFGENENCVDPALLAQEHQMFAQATGQGWTVFASSGDSGAAQFTCDGKGATKVASSPASDPLVTGVGGTTLNATTDPGTYVGETAWTEKFGCNPPAVSNTDVNCSGGGYSDLYSRPSYQFFEVHGPKGRGVPDVAYNAGVNGGVITVCSVCNAGVPAFFLFGGTSAGSPQWAGLAAIADQMAGQRLGEINPALYAMAMQPQHSKADLHDIKTGNNDVSEIGGGYQAKQRWDPVTGLGTPNAAKLLPDLINRIAG